MRATWRISVSSPKRKTTASSMALKHSAVSRQLALGRRGEIDVVRALRFAKSPSSRENRHAPALLNAKRDAHQSSPMARSTLDPCAQGCGSCSSLALRNEAHVRVVGNRRGPPTFEIATTMATSLEQLSKDVRSSPARLG
jgi:hypothetical protein